jgi:FAD/FMN-containing dehydrogenase
LSVHTQADIVRGITFVDGTGNVTRVSRNSHVGRGLVGGVGMLGVITEITVQLRPGIGKTKIWGTGVKSDANFAQDLLQLWVSFVLSYCQQSSVLNSQAAFMHDQSRCVAAIVQLFCIRDIGG